MSHLLPWAVLCGSVWYYIRPYHRSTVAKSWSPAIKAREFNVVGPVLDVEGTDQGRVLLIDVLLEGDCKRAKRKGRSTVQQVSAEGYIAMVCSVLLKGEDEVCDILIPFISP